MRISDLRSGTSIGNVYANKLSSLKNGEKSSTLGLRESNKKAGFGGLIKDIQEIIEKKREQISDLASNENLSKEIKKLRKEDLEKQIEELQEQLDVAILEEQKKAAEEQAKKKKKGNNIDENSENEDFDSEKFTEMIVSASGNMQSIQKFKLFKAEKQRDQTRINQEMEADSKIGVHSDLKASELSEAKSAIRAFDDKINDKISDINEEVKEYSETSIENAEDKIAEKEDKQNTEKNIDENASINDENSNIDENKSYISHDVAEKYYYNSFDNYKANNGRTIDASK